MPLVRKSKGGRRGNHSDDEESTPICRCRVLYLGSAVPHITKDGLQGIQEPLKELYPDTGLSSLKGIDSWLSVWSNGLLLENVDEKNTKITRFFPIESLHYCAAVRNVLVPANGPHSGGNTTTTTTTVATTNGASSSERVQKFLPLDSPFARIPNSNHPPLFACILRRTSGIKVLECHAFICKREIAANALVRCCFHAYADSTYAKTLENGGGNTSTLQSSVGGNLMKNGYTNGGTMTNGGTNGSMFGSKDSENGMNRSMQRSVTPLDSIEKVNGWQAHSQNGDSDIIAVANSTDDDFTDGPMTSTPRDKYEFRAEFQDEDEIEIYEGDENHKVWGGNGSTIVNGNSSELVYLEPDGTLKSVKSHASRMSRPRQMISPTPPPPPPPQHYSFLKSMEDDGMSTGKKKNKKKLKKESKSQQQLAKGQGPFLIRPASMMNLSSAHGMGPGLSTRPGSVLNGPVSARPSSAMSTLQRNGRPGPGGHHPMHHGPPFGHPLIPMQHNGAANGYAMIPGYGPQPIYGHLPPQFAMHPGMVTTSKSKKKNKSPVPILTPMPMLAPTPMHMHHHHHHPGGRPMGPNGELSLSPLPPPGMYHPHHHPHGMPKMMPSPDELKMMKQAAGQSSSSQQSTPEMLGGPPSHYATIERGYHYRSHHMNGDSATLVSNKSGPLSLRPSGSPPTSAEGLKKEREIIQMVRDLDLSGDEIERSQVPPELYPPRKANGYHHRQNGHGPRITHR